MIKELLLLMWCRERVAGRYEYSRLQFNWRVSVRWLLDSRVGIKRIAVGDQKWRLSIEDAADMCMCTYITVCAAITVRNPKLLLGHRTIFIQRTSLEMRDQIRSWDVRSKYTYILLCASSSFRSTFPCRYISFQFWQRSHDVM